MNMTKTKKSPHPVDIHVGKKLRERRVMLNMSQHKLADEVDITFQQVQKYERGLNRVSASRLFEFATILSVPITYFYENLGSAANAIGLSDNEQEGFEGPNEDVDENDMKYLIKQPESARLLKYYYSIKDEKLRKELYNMILRMAKSMNDDQSS